MKITNFKLEDLATISAGGTPKRSESTFWNGGEIPWVKIKDIKEKYVTETEEKITELGLEKSSAKLFPKGTILYTIFATLGECAILDIDATTNQAIAGIKVKSDQVLSDYLYYYLKSIKGEVINQGRGVAQNNINLKILRNIIVPVPSIENQKNIIKILQVAENVIGRREQQIEALSALKQSVFLDMFDTVSTNKYNFKIDSLGNYTNLVTSGSTPKGGAKSYLDEGIPLIRSQNVLWNEFDIRDVAYIAEETHESMRRSQLNNKDVLFNITGASIGRCSVYEGDDNSANVNQHVCIIRLNDKINPYYLSYFLTGIEFQKNVVSKNIGATRQAFNYTQIKNFNLLVPDISLQNEFEDKVKQIDTSISSVKESLKQLNSMYDTLLHKAFSGELFKKETEV